MYKLSVIKEICEQNNLIFDKNATDLKSIILNFPSPEHPHGCARKCTYCNWKTHPLAQQLIYPDFELLDEYLQGSKGLITISGGGDPLYNLYENLSSVMRLIDHILELGHPVRVITRERDNALKLLRYYYKKLLISISVDCPEEIPAPQLEGYKDYVEYSTVLSPEIMRDLLRTSSAWSTALGTGAQVILREPLNTTWKSNLALLMNLKVRYPDLEFSTEQACYEANYLVGNKVLSGFDIFEGGERYAV